MTSDLALVAVGLCLVIPPKAFGAPQAETPAPIYSVTVISHGLAAVNYQNQSGPTKIDFKGTVLAPNAHGQAIVESKKGGIEVDCKFTHLEAPQRFGGAYLTYVLWAITPDGRTVNLGEIVPSPSDKAEVRVSIDLPVFGLLVTAEPYYSVSLPGEVVVLENEVRRDTVGAVEQVHPKYELLPRGIYTYQVKSPQSSTNDVNAPKVSMDQYEALLQLYQAQNAVQIAQSLGADQLAPDIYSKAVRLLEQAREYQKEPKGAHSVVTAARAATESAEDARQVAVRRREEKGSSSGAK